MADIFAVIADGTRRDILSILLDRRTGREGRSREISVSEIVAHLELSQPTVSKHLKVLREAELVTVREEGQHRYYALEYTPLEAVEDWLIPFLTAEEEAEQALIDESTAARAENLGRVIADRTHQMSTVVHDLQRGATKVAEALRIKK
ncbi:winged helix-turn-helix transcriptional regulator [Microbacteriaceae bacterium VKM Ac-2855]|nr:winged helix-turn-helix transcriptional regulator [Microbacteriaceae bacterium VKM Ac-2855]